MMRPQARACLAVDRGYARRASMASSSRTVTALALASMGLIACGRLEALVDRARGWLPGEAGEGPEVGEAEEVVVGPPGPRPVSPSEAEAEADAEAEPALKAVAERESPELDLGGGRPVAKSDIPASFEPPSEDGGDTGAAAGADTGGTAVAAVSGEEADAACLEGTWEIEDVDAHLRKELRRHSHGRRLRPRSTGGTLTLRFDKGATTGGTMHGAADHRVHAYATELAGVEVSYRVELDGDFDASWRITAPARLRIDPPSTGRVAGRLRVEVGPKVDKRVIAYPEHGEFELSCKGDDLSLTPRRGTKLGEPITWHRGHTTLPAGSAPGGPPGR